MNKPITGSLNVFVRRPDRTIEPVPVDQPGALPVQSGGAMVMDVELDAPAFIFLVWINSANEFLPLYPWNNDTLETQDINQPPPQRRMTHRIFSPLFGRSWTFDNRSGVETVVLLARRTPLPEAVQVGYLFNSPPPSNLERPNDIIEVRITSDGAGEPSQSSKALRPKEVALADYLGPLAKHFQYIHAVQFAHEDKKPAESTENGR